MGGLLLRGWNWCRRFRKRCGYGVHSPSDFFLITFVVYEKLPYYAYEILRNIRGRCDRKPEHREKADKLLFRIVNYLQPGSLLEIGTGSGISTLYMAEGNKKMKVLTYSDNPYHTIEDLSGCRNDIVYHDTGLNGFLSMLEASVKKPDLIHIAHTDLYETAFEAVLPYVSSRTCVIVSLPYSDEARKKWWKRVVEDPRTGVTFDLYDVGLVFFDPKRVKEHRVVNFL